jgi:adenylate cyclase
MNLHGALTVRRLRLLSGLVMFAYIAMHLVNHALGIVSLALAEGGLRLALAFWRSPPATLLLYGAAAVHFSLALWTLYSRREWRLPFIEVVRLGSGFSLPLLLISHAVTTRLGDTLFAIRPSYTAIVAGLLAAGTQGLQLALLAPGWLHGCLGLWITLRRFPALQRMRHWLVALVVVVPVAAALGFVRMAQEVSATRAPPPVGTDAQHMILAAWMNEITIGYLGAIVAAFALGRLHALWQQRPV